MRGIYEILMFPFVTHAIICDIVRDDNGVTGLRANGDMTDSNGKTQQVYGKDYITLHE